MDQTNTVVLEKEIKEDLNGTQSLRRAQSPPRETKKSATFDQIKVSDITSKAKTQIVSIDFNITPVYRKYLIITLRR